MSDRDRLAELLHGERDNDDCWPDDDATHTLGDCTVDPEGWREYADRLLAAGVTLAAPDDDTCPRCGANRHQQACREHLDDAAPSPDLAVLLDTDWWTRALSSRNGSDRGMAEFVVATIKAASPPPATPDAERLDVERLTRALYNLRHEGPPDDWEVAGRLIAAEYVRLAQPPTATEPEP